MRKVQLTAPECIEFLEVPLPQVEPGWVLAKPLRTGVCGTDVHSYYGETIFGKVFPFHIGHEICAKVESVGDGCLSLKPGDTIVINPFFTCGSCASCYMGQENDCKNKTTIGLKGFGGFSEYIYVPVTSTYKVTSNNYDAMCLAEPLATVVYGFDKLRLDPTKTMLIQGVGSIGLLFLQLAVSANLKKVYVSDFNPKKLKKAKEIGAAEAFCPAIPEEREALDAKKFDIVVDCTGSIQAMSTTIDRISFGGQILLFGLCSAEASMSIKPFQLYQKDAVVMASYALNKRTFCKAVSLLESGAIRTDVIIDSVQPLDKLEEKIKQIASGGADGKIIIDLTK